MDLSLKDLLQLAPGVGLTGALIFFIWGGYRKHWVWGYQLEDRKNEIQILKEECRLREEAWKDEAHRNASMAEAAREMAREALTSLREAQAALKDLQDGQRGRSR